MSQALMDDVCAFHALERAMAALRVAELSLSDEHSSALAVSEAHDAVRVAARQVTRATDELPFERQPKNWGTT